MSLCVDLGLFVNEEFVDTVILGLWSNLRETPQAKQVFMLLSGLRFGAFWFFIKRFFRLVERKHPKDTVKCFFSCTLSICVNRFQL